MILPRVVINRLHYRSCYTVANINFNNLLSIENENLSKKRMLAYPNTLSRWHKSNPDITKAAVLMLMYNHKTSSGQTRPAVIFTKRSHLLNSHKGQISFPGGKVDKTDNDHLMTALREAEEEIGLSPEKVNIWGQLPAIPGNNFAISITPVIGAYDGDLNVENLAVNVNEVSEVFSCYVEDLCANAGYTRFRYKGKFVFNLPMFKCDDVEFKRERRIWGITAAVLQCCFSVLTNDQQFKEACVITETQNL